MSATFLDHNGGGIGSPVTLSSIDASARGNATGFVNQSIIDQALGP